MNISRAPSERWSKPLGERQQIRHLLSRITFGPRLGDLDRARQFGVNRFLEQQLHSQELDNSPLEARLENLQTLAMSPTELAAAFPPPMQVNRRQEKRFAPLGRGEDSAIMTPAAESGSQNVAMPARTAGGQANAAEMDTIPLGTPGAQSSSPREILIQLSQEQLLRAVYSQRQLEEIMVRLWMNHFNVYWPKGADRYYVTSFEQDVIRPRALGNFEDLLLATAHSPAMLFYLDNWMSVSPEQQGQLGPFDRERFHPAGFETFEAARPPRARAQNRRGLNENYARELMELHTIGLHYAQKDVTEVARCFTGWTLLRPARGGGFYFNPGMHDYGQKVVLGHTIPAGQGIEDGLNVLHILAVSPSTAQRISAKLCQHFVADDPPTVVVDRAAQTFLQTRGNVRSVLQTILNSPEFYSRGAYQAKLKSPLEYVASALRALGAETDGGRPLPGWISQMGEPLFQYEAPSGYDDAAKTWINSSTLLARLNFAMALCLGRIPGTSVDWKTFASEAHGGSSRDVLTHFVRKLTGGSLSLPTQSINLGRLSVGDDGSLSAGQDMRMIAALTIASPEFQRR